MLSQGRVIAAYCKRELPNYQVFAERRYFASGRKVAQSAVVFEVDGLRFGLLGVNYPELSATTIVSGAVGR